MLSAETRSKILDNYYLLQTTLQLFVHNMRAFEMLVKINHALAQRTRHYACLVKCIARRECKTNFVNTIIYLLSFAFEFQDC